MMGRPALCKATEMGDRPRLLQFFLTHPFSEEFSIAQIMWSVPHFKDF